MSIDTTFLWRCIETLEQALQGFEESTRGDFRFRDIFRAACVKEFELVVAQSGKLLRKRLAGYFSADNHATSPRFREAFRYAAKFDLMETEAVESWFKYQDLRNNTAHDYGENYAEATIEILPQFIEDAKTLADLLGRSDDE